MTRGLGKSWPSQDLTRVAIWELYVIVPKGFVGTGIKDASLGKAELTMNNKRITELEGTMEVF